MVSQKRAPSALMRPIIALGRSMLGLFNSWMSSYPSLDPTRKVFDGLRPRYSSSNQTLAPNITQLSAQCRHIERSTPLGRAVSEGLTADIIGSGIGILPNTGNAARDAQFMQAFNEWAESCMVDGSSLWAWQSVVPRELCTTGNALARWVVQPERIRKGLIPLALLPLEFEWLSELPVGPVPNGNFFVRGVVIDILGVPVAYHLRNPELPIGNPGEIVAADQFIHIFERRRPQQVIGEPILAPAVERILQDARLVETELKGAVVSAAAPSVVIESPFNNVELDEDQEPITNIPGGSVARTLPGEKISVVPNGRPSQQIAPFRETILGDVAASCRTSRSWLSRDPSKANFSSMRDDSIKSKRVLVGLKALVGCGAAGKVYEGVFSWLALRLGVALPSDPMLLCKMMKYDLRPDEQEYVDPTKDVQASVNAIANNLSTFDTELGNRGKDFASVVRQRAVENEMLLAAGLPIPTPEKSPNTQTAQDNTDTGEPIDAEDTQDKADEVAA